MRKTAKKTEYELLINIGAQVNKSMEASVGKVTGLLKAAFGAKVVWDGVTWLGEKIIDIGSQSVAMYSELETAAINAANVFGGTRQEVDAIEDSIMNLAVETSKEIPYTAKEIADSVYYLGQVGLGFEEATAVMDDMLKLAYTDGQDVATVVDMITDSMSGLKMEITPENVNSYMNQIAQIMATTNTSAMGALETIMGFGGTSGLLRSNIQEVSTSLGILANSGIKGSEAGTALNSIMTRMISDTRPVRDAYDKLGVSLYDDTGTFRGFGEVLEDVNEELKTMSDEQKNPLLKQMFGTYYMNAAQILLDAVDAGESGVSVYDELLEKQYSVGNRLEQMYENATDRMGAKTQLFQNNLDALRITIGDSLAPALTEVLDWTTEKLFPDLENGVNGLADFIETSITPNIGGWMDEGYTFVTNTVDKLQDYFSSPEWAGLAESAQNLGSNVVNGLLDADWDAVFKAAGNIGEATANIAGGLIDIANAATKFAESPLGQLLGFAVVAPIKGLGEAMGYVNDAITIFRESFDQGLEGKSEFEGHIEQAARAKGEADLYKQQIEAIQQLMSEEKDSKQLKIYQGQIDELNAKMEAAMDNFQRLAQVAMGNPTTVYIVGPRQKPSTQSKSTGTSSLIPFADGGIVTRPTIGLIGEADEKEAVIPLSKLGSVVGQLTGGGNITYTQVVHINGNANPDEVKQAMSQSYAEFKANWQRLQKEQRRAAF